MTFFLQEPQRQIDLPARGTDTPLTSLWGGISAAVQKEQLESNANFRSGRERIASDDELAVEAARHMGADKIGGMVDAFNERARAAGMAERQMPADMADLPSVFGPNFSKAVLDEARNDPEWNGPDVSPETTEKRTNERMQKEHRDLTETLNAMGAGRWAAEIVGGIAGATADVRNLPFLAVGGGTGSLARIMGREAMLNVAAEGATMPDRFGMAERLNIPEPDVALTLAYAAAGGAIFGGAVEGLARGITYWRGTRTGNRTDIPRYEQEAGANAAEDAIADMAQPFQRIRESTHSTATRQSVEYDTTPTIARTGEVEAVAPPPSATPLNDLFDTPEARGGVGERQMDLEDLIAEAQARDPVAQEARSAPPAQPDTPEAPAPILTASSERELHRLSGGSKPLTEHIKRVYGGIQPGTRLAAELNARGITSKTAPGLFKKAGRPGFDNIPAAEEPHLAAVLGDDGNGYLSEDALAGALIDEAGGIPMPVSREQVDARVELDERRAEQERLDREAAVAAGQELDDQLFRLPEAPGWVDNPKEREAIHEARMSDLRELAGVDDSFSIGGLRVSDILDEMDADNDFAEMIQMCGRRATA